MDYVLLMTLCAGLGGFCKRRSTVSVRSLLSDQDNGGGGDRLGGKRGCARVFHPFAEGVREREGGLQIDLLVRMFE